MKLVKIRVDVLRIVLVLIMAGYALLILGIVLLARLRAWPWSVQQGIGWGLAFALGLFTHALTEVELKPWFRKLMLGYLAAYAAICLAGREEIFEIAFLFGLPLVGVISIYVWHAPAPAASHQVSSTEDRS